MRDQYQREIDYVRISVTDRCNFRCRYCMPREGVKFADRSEIMTCEEILRFCRAVSGIGIHKVKITGGEPLVRRGVCDLIREIRRIPGIESVTLTTNGMLLGEYLPALEDAGLTGINVSLDTLNTVKFRRITGTDGFSEVWKGICKAVKTSIPVKINCIPMREWNEDELADMAFLAKQFPVMVRFIEMMPMGKGRDYTGIPQEEVKDILRKRFGKMAAAKGRFGNGPAVYYELSDFQGKVGFISAVSHEFCGACNRIRLTADGILKPCLNYAGRVNLRQEMRSGITDQELRYLVKEAIYWKPRRHGFGDEAEEEIKEKRRMAGIGG